MVAGVLLLIVITTHRLASPFVALKRTFAAIERGDTKQRLRFHKYDHLDDVEEAFNRLMDSMQEDKKQDDFEQAA